MSAVQLSCPSCHTALQAADFQGREERPCPRCGQLIRFSSPAPADGQWYYARGQQRFGPVSTTQLRQLLAAGQVRPTDMVLQAGTQKWLPASSLDGLCDQVIAVRVPPARPLASAPAVPAEALPRPEARPLQSGSAGWASTIWLHLRRAFSWDLRGIPLTAGERSDFATQGIEHPTLQRYLGWRRSVLFVAFVPVALIALLSTADTLGDDNRMWSGLGRLWLALMILAPFALPVTVALAAVTWSNDRLSRRLIVHGWVVSFVAPLLLLLVPAHWLIDFHHSDARVEALGELGARWLFGLGFFAALCIYLPIFAVSMAAGVQRACLRLKPLLPESPVPGLFLAASAPVLPLALFPFFVLVNQVASNGLLILGMLALMASPLIYAVRFRLFTRPLLVPEDEQSVWRVQWLAKGLFWLGALLLLVFALTREWLVPRTGGGLDELFGGLDRKTLLGFSEETSLFQPWSWRLLRWLVIELLGRSLFTTVLVADLFMRVNKVVWSCGRQLAISPRVSDYDRLMALLDRPGLKDQAVTEPADS